MLCADFFGICLSELREEKIMQHDPSEIAFVWCFILDTVYREKMSSTI